MGRFSLVSGQHTHSSLSAGLSFANFIKVLGTIVEPKVPRASETAMGIIDGFSAFEAICRGKHTSTITKKDLHFFVGALGDPLPAEDIERFVRFVGLEGSPLSAEVDYRGVVSTLMTAARAAKA